MASVQKFLPILLAGAVLAVLAVAGVSIALRATVPAPVPGPLVVYCDDALAAVMDDIVNAFQRRSDVRVEVRYVPASSLGAPHESEAGVLVVTGDRFQLGGSSALVETRAVAWALPVILVRDGNPEGIRTVGDLGRPELNLGVADPDQTALGTVTSSIFAHYGLGEGASPPNIAFTSRTGADLGNAVRMGRVDAAVVWEPMALAAVRTDFVRIPPREDHAVPVTAGLLSDVPSTGAAREFMEFLEGRAAQNFFDQYHYAIVTPW